MQERPEVLASPPACARQPTTATDARAPLVPQQQVPQPHRVAMADVDGVAGNMGGLKVSSPAQANAAQGSSKVGRAPLPPREPP